MSKQHWGGWLWIGALALLFGGVFIWARLVGDGPESRLTQAELDEMFRAYEEEQAQAVLETPDRYCPQLTGNKAIQCLAEVIVSLEDERDTLIDEGRVNRYEYADDRYDYYGR